ncbi:MAG: hypothetical protein EA402_12685 [Planctomycetota bacterium]|nr:MAG: hypothetical protein EA402_12685 [Planctomycetota bacterium]
MGFVSPLALLGLAAIALPILIHLLVRQRPRPRDWAAMAWLAAAVVQAQRRYRLTNFLLLLLRCLAVALIALAVARPLISGLGGGGSLVLVVDMSTSMGETASGRPLSTLAAEWETLDPPFAEVVVLTVGESVLPRHRGSWAEALRVLEGLEVDTMAGGLDAAATESQEQRLLDAVPARSVVLLISDFRQDRGEAVEEVLNPVASAVHRLRLGDDGPNALVTAVEPPVDALPGRPSRLRLRILGESEEGWLQINQGNPELVRLQGSENDGQGRWLTLDVPPLPVGQYLIRLELVDQGLSADNVVEYPLRVRSGLQVFGVLDQPSFVDTALEADPARIDYRQLSPAAVAATPLPSPGGLLVLRERAPLSLPILEWIGEGGLVWADWSILQADPRLAEVVAARVEHLEGAASGRLHSGEADLDTNFARTVVESWGALRARDEDRPLESLLTAGESTVIGVFPYGRGWIIVEADGVARDTAFRTTGALPEWVVRTVRRLSARVDRPWQLESGTRPDRPWQLMRGGERRQLDPTMPANLRPGWWAVDHQHPDYAEDPAPVPGLVVLPNVEEGILRALPGTQAWSDTGVIDAAQGSRDWALWILLALLGLLLAEGAFAAWAGRTYGR